MPNARVVSGLSDHAPAKASAKGLAFGALVLAIVLAGVGSFLFWGGELSIQQFVDTLRSWGMWGVVGSVGLMMIHSFIPFPAELLACANGMVYGPVWGTVITWTGAMLGAVIAFALARRLGRPFVEHMVAQRDWHVLDNWAAEKGWRVVLIARFVPVIAFNLINYAAGLVRLTWWQFLWTTGVGILPLTVLMVVMGDNIESLGWKSWTLLLVAALSLWFVLYRTLKHQPKSSSSDDYR